MWNNQINQQVEVRKGPGNVVFVYATDGVNPEQCRRGTARRLLTAHPQYKKTKQIILITCLQYIIALRQIHNADRLRSTHVEQVHLQHMAHYGLPQHLYMA